LKPRQLLLSLAAALLFLALLVYGSYRTHFRWDILAAQTHTVRWSSILAGMALIYIAYVVRALRWWAFLRPTRKLPPFYLLGTQLIGFTAVALLGRVADLTRPYLVAKRSNTPLPLQIAIYTVERMFDAGSMAVIVALALLLAPDRATMPHREMAMAGARSSLAAAIALIVLTIVVRLAGERLAALIESTLPHKLAHAVASKIRGFRQGLVAVASAGALLQGAVLSLAMWSMISSAYLLAVRAFYQSPVLGSMTLGRAVILMAASIVGSVVPIPIVSWFFQILVLQQTMQRLYGVPAETALACGAAITLVTFLCVIPAGLIWSRFEHISLQQVSEESEHVAEALESGAQV
jgi:glycosyltransferase 2 family protein